MGRRRCRQGPRVPDGIRHKEERAAKAALEAQVALDAPKVLFADAVSTSKTDILVGDLAKILKGNADTCRAFSPEV